MSTPSVCPNSGIGGPPLGRQAAEHKETALPVRAGRLDWTFVLGRIDAAPLVAWIPVFAIVLFVVRPPAWTIDDAIQFELATRNGPVMILVPYAGFLLPFQWLVVLAETTLGIWTGSVAAGLATLAVAGFVASSRMSILGRWRYVLALVICVFDDGVTKALGNVQWVTGMYLIAMLVADPPARRWRWLDALALIVAGLTGPLSILLAPLFALRARDPRFRWAATWVCLAAVLQLVTRVSAVRYQQPVDPGLIPSVLLLRGGVAAALIAITVRWQPRLGLFALGLAIGLPLAGIISANHHTAELLDPAVDERYFFLPKVIAVGMMMVVLTAEHRQIARCGGRV